VSRVGKNPIVLPDTVQVKIAKNVFSVTGPKGSLSRWIDPDIKVEVKDGSIAVTRPTDNKNHRSLHGLYRSLLNNMVQGVASGFEKKLEIVGVGYKAEMMKDRLTVQVGYSHAIVFVPPEGIEIVVPNPTSITIRGIDKELVGQVAAKIRSFRPPEPYKGKGIKYAGEHIRRKAGKTAT
jgi:large subunit ribosomal protein L6